MTTAPWHPRSLVRLAVPLLLILVLAGADRQPAVRALLRAWQQPAHYGAVLLDVLLAVYAVRAVLGMVRVMLAGYLGHGHARTAAKFVGALLYGLVGALAITAVGINLSGVFVGAGLTGVVLGLAAQASLGNVIAGVVVLFARPYTVGRQVQVSLSGEEYNGVVRDVGLLYTTLEQAEREIRVPNGMMLAAVIVLPVALLPPSDEG